MKNACFILGQSAYVYKQLVGFPMRIKGQSALNCKNIGMVLCTEDSAKIRGGGCNTPVLIPMN
jgi:hypothetical protein